MCIKGENVGEPDNETNLKDLLMIQLRIGYDERVDIINAIKLTKT